MRTKLAALPIAASLALAGVGVASAQDAYPPPERDEGVEVLPEVVERPAAPDTQPDAPAPGGGEDVPAAPGDVEVAPGVVERPAPGEVDAAPVQEAVVQEAVVQEEGLALTGADALVLAASALAALLVGGLMLFRSRRRAHARS